MKKLPIIFFGSSDFSVFVLKTILKKYKPLIIITLPPKPQGRNLKLELNPVAKLSLKEKIPFLEIENWDEFQEKTKNIPKIVGLIAGFGKIIPEKIIQQFKLGILNVHPSLLPKYRGPNPIREAILNEEKETGITIILIDNEIDHGPTLAQRKIKLNNTENYLELLRILGKLGGETFNEIIEDYLDGKIKPIPQNHNLATYTRKFTKEDGILNITETFFDWSKKIRALNPWPGTYIYINLKGNKKILKIFSIEKINQSEIRPEYQKLKIGEFFQHKNYLALRLKDAFIILKEIQLESKKKMSSREFLNGYPLNSFSLWSEEKEHIN